MINLKVRSTEKEIMDDLSISGEVVDQTLRELDVINRYLGGNQISLLAFRKIVEENAVKSLVDLGCGGADILKEMALLADKSGQEIAFRGIDANAEIIAYARNNTSDFPNIDFQAINIFSKEFGQQKFDIIHSCLFTHHFTKAELITCFKSWKTQARKSIIINDLHRHWLAYYSIKVITRLFSKSYMVRNDAAVSVARGFKKSELISILHEAGIDNYQIKWKWAFRWQIVIMI